MFTDVSTKEGEVSFNELIFLYYVGDLCTCNGGIITVVYCVCAECIHTTELAGHVSRGMPMVVNPIYEEGAIYEEIRDPSTPKFHEDPTPTEREEGYVSISSAAATSGKCCPVCS